MALRWAYFPVFCGGACDAQKSLTREHSHFLATQAEFSGGKLVCNGRVAVRKDQDGWVIDGPVCPDYYRVRSLLYSQFACV
jgi:hypothetical protein